MGIGDDACVLPDGTVVTTDAYAEEVHFSFSYMNHTQIGERCACAALSDIVAMGAEPEVLLVALALPTTPDSTNIRSLYQGIERICAELGCEVAGGDIIRSPVLTLTLTALGKTTQPLLRSSARPGDWLYVTGYMGSAEAGRLVLKNRLPRLPCRRLLTRHLRPLPRLKTMLKLKPVIHALIDTSDGIATDAWHLAQTSKVKIVISPRLFPLLPETKSVCRRLGIDPYHFALCSGEDYELLFTSPALLPKKVAGVTVTRIGRVEKGSGLYTEDKGRTEAVVFTGYDHLASSLT